MSLEDLKEVLAVEIDLDGERYLSRTEMPGHAYAAFKALKLRPTKHIQQIE